MIKWAPTQEENAAKTLGEKKPLLLSVLLPVFLVLGFWVLSRSIPNFEFDPDEGFNLMKALLVQRDYPLYAEVLSDQPPLFTLILATIFRWVGPSVEAGRLLVMVFSALLLWGAFRFLQLARDTSAATWGLIVITLLPQYINLSFSVMIGLPALSLAMLALVAQVHWHRRHNPVSLVSSAILMALSLLIKGFTFLLVPVLAVGLLLDRGDGDWKLRIKHLALWSVCFLALLIILTWTLVGFSHLEQLWVPHRLAQDLPEFRRMTAGVALRKIQALLALALVGAWGFYRRREWLMLYPLAWMLIAVAVLAGHKPVWPHQQLLVSLPAALLAVEPLRKMPRLFRLIWRRRANLRQGLAGLLLLLVVSFQVRHTYVSANYWKNRVARRQMEAREWKLTEAMRAHAAESRWTVTDRPIFAFRCGLVVPPELAVISRKRVATGLADSEMLTIIARRRPEQVVLLRFQWPAVRSFLEKNYRRHVIESDRDLYLIQPAGGERSY